MSDVLNVYIEYLLYLIYNSPLLFSLDGYSMDYGKQDLTILFDISILLFPILEAYLNTSNLLSIINQCQACIRLIFFLKKYSCYLPLSSDFHNSSIVKKITSPS